MRHPRGIVTPEAVRLEFAEATVGSRGAALLMDWLIQGAALIALNVVLSLVLGSGDASLPDWLEISTALILNFLVIFGYPVAFETLLGGRSPGKLVFGLRVVTSEGAPVQVRHAAIRAALGLVDFAVTAGVAAVVASLVSPRSQRLGDMVAGTVVIRERFGQPAPAAASFAVPKGAEDYAQTIDPSGLRPRDYQTLRTFLLRAPELPAANRDAIAADLARTLAARLGHEPPPDVSPPVFLRSLAARYQERGATRPSSATAALDPSRPSPQPPPRIAEPGDFTPPA